MDLSPQQTAATDPQVSAEPLAATEQSESMLRHRMGHLRPCLLVFGALWTLSVPFFLLKPGLQAAGAVTLVAAAVNGLLLFVHHKRWLSKGVIVNLFLAQTTATLIGLAIAIGPGRSTVHFHFPVICLVAAQLLGMRAAISWFSLTVLATYFSVYPPVDTGYPPNPNAFDQLISALALSVAVIWVCEQAERFFIVRTGFLQRLTDSLKEQTRLLGLAEETASIGHWRWDLTTDTIEYSDELKRVCALPESELSAPSIEQLTNRFDDPGSQQFRDALQNAKRTGTPFTIDLSFRDSKTIRYLTCRGVCETGANGNVDAVFGVIRDETSLIEATQRLSKKADELNRLATFDPLTGLSNRLHFRQQLNTAVGSACSDDQEMWLVVLDMDGFKEINDTLGHAAGDFVLQETAARLQKQVAQDDVVSRLGGDEFTVILRNPESVKNALQICHQIIASIHEPMIYDNTTMQVGASVGTSVCPRDSKSSEELFTFADTAMYSAKFSGQDVVLYEPSMTEELVKRKKVESKLAVALAREEFSIVYQPQYNVQTRRIVGFEALMRWNQNGTLVSPAEFIPLLESSGKIIEAGQWVLDQACHQVQKWQNQGFDIRIAVNISPVQFRDPSFYDRVVETFSKYQIDPSKIDMEITEGVIISDVKRTSETLAKLKSLGCMISIDDFGTGYSSLAYLRNFPIDQLKIDQAFIRDIPKHDDGTIASSIVVLGLSLGMEVLAEGVETECQLEFLKTQDCHLFQGRLGSMPISESECLALLEQERQRQLVSTKH